MVELEKLLTIFDQEFNVKNIVDNWEFCCDD